MRDAARPLPIKGLEATSVVPWPVNAARQKKKVECSNEAFVVEDASNCSPPPKRLILGQVALDNCMPQFQRWDESINRLQILLCSATLANDPQMLAPLGLLNPVFYTAAEDSKRGSSDQLGGGGGIHRGPHYNPLLRLWQNLVALKKFCHLYRFLHCCKRM